MYCIIQWTMKNNIVLQNKDYIIWPLFFNDLCEKITNMVEGLYNDTVC